MRSWDLSPLGVATLALLIEGPAHAYEMFQIIATRPQDRIAAIRPGTFYHTVSRLADEGLIRVRSREREGNRPERTLYEITNSGQEALRRRVAALLGKPVAEYPELLVALREAHNLPVSVVIRQLEARVLMINDELDRVNTDIAELEAQGLPRQYWLNVQFARVLREVEKTWLERLVTDLTSGSLRWT